MGNSNDPPAGPDRGNADEIAAADANVDKSKLPGRDLNPAPPQPPRDNPTNRPASPHAVFHEGDDQHRQEPRQYSGIVPADPDDSQDDDEFALNEGYETASTGSTSVTSSVYAHTYENGRRYQHFKNSRYPIPNDDEELNREDMKHAMLLELCDGELFYAPIGENPQLILDIGTGTGESAFRSILSSS